MVDRSESSKDKCTSVEIKSTSKPAWKKIPLKSVEIFNDSIIPGNFGSIVLRGTFSLNSGKKRETCLIKMLKGTTVPVFGTKFYGTLELNLVKT